MTGSMYPERRRFRKKAVLDASIKRSGVGDGFSAREAAPPAGSAPRLVRFGFATSRPSAEEPDHTGDSEHHPGRHKENPEPS
jgi:hypothetical protein